MTIIKLYEIDYKFTSEYVERSLDQIKNDLKSGVITRNEALAKSNELIVKINTEINLSDLTHEEIGQLIPLILLIRLFIKKYNLSN